MKGVWLQGHSSRCWLPSISGKYLNRLKLGPWRQPWQTACCCAHCILHIQMRNNRKKVCGRRESRDNRDQAAEAESCVPAGPEQSAKQVRYGQANAQDADRKRARICAFMTSSCSWVRMTKPTRTTDENNFGRDR